MNTSSSDTEYKKVRREVAETWPETRTREMALQILRSKLYELEMRARAEKVQEAHKSKKDIAWGSQIRSYVLAPYRLVKDHRTGHEAGNVDAVLDGDIMEFIRTYLLSGGEGRETGGEE